MPEANAATQGASGAGGPGQAGTPGQPPAQPGVAAAPPSGGPAPAAPPAQPAGVPPAEGAATAQTTESRPQGQTWKEASESLRVTGEEKRNRDRDRELTRLRDAEKRLKETLGEDYMAAAQRMRTAQATPPMQPQPAAPTQVAQPQPIGTGRGLDPQQALAWHQANFQKLYYGYATTEVVNDPETGMLQQVQKQVPPDINQARAYAEEFDAVVRTKGRPPWDGIFGLGQSAPQPQPQGVADGQQLSPAQVEDILAQREGARENWSLSFNGELQQAASTEFGPEWFQQPVQVNLAGHPVALPRWQALQHLCKPSRDYPNGLSLRAGLLAYMPDEAYEQKGLVAEQRGLSRAGGLGGAVQSSGPSGPPLGPSERQERAAVLQQGGHTDSRWAAEPPADAARVIRVPSAGGRSSGIPHV